MVTFATLVTGAMSTKGTTKFECAIVATLFTAGTVIRWTNVKSVGSVRVRRVERGGWRVNFAAGVCVKSVPRLVGGALSVSCVKRVEMPV